MMSLGEMAQISQDGDREATCRHVVWGMMIVGVMIWQWWVVVYEKTLRVRTMIRCYDRSSTEDYRWGWRKCNWWTGEQRMDRNWREEISSSMSMSTMAHYQRKKPMKTLNFMRTIARVPTRGFRWPGTRGNPWSAFLALKSICIYRNFSYDAAQFPGLWTRKEIPHLAGR